MTPSLACRLPLTSPVCSQLHSYYPCLSLTHAVTPPLKRPHKIPSLSYCLPLPTLLQSTLSWCSLQGLRKALREQNSFCSSQLLLACSLTRSPPSSPGSLASCHRMLPFLWLTFHHCFHSLCTSSHALGSLL